MFRIFKTNNNDIDIGIKERLVGSFFGFFVGDSLGVPVEFVERDVLRKNRVTKMLEYGTHNQPIGSWSDDTSMVIATMDSMVGNHGVHYHDIMDHFLKWFKNGDFTPSGRVFDIGNSTSNALLKYQKDNSTFLCGSDDIYSNGNGSLMRILPISLYLHYTGDNKIEIIHNVSAMTHAHDYSVFACVIYSVFIDEYLTILDLKKAYFNMQITMKKIIEDSPNSFFGDLEDLKEKFGRILSGDISSLKEDDISSSGYVIDSLEACFWCLLNTDNYKDAVLKAVNLGDDTDTIAALTGALAGLVYGYNDIPQEWISVLKRKEYLEELVNQFYNYIMDLSKQEISNMWVNGLGDMNKVLQGENPLPKKDIKATSESWKCIPFSKSRKIDCSIILTISEFEILSMGHIPEVMEDHWFMYCDQESVNYFRSWTGIQIFKGYYKYENNSYIIYSLEVNDNKEEYKEEDMNKALELFHNLVINECEVD